MCNLVLATQDFLRLLNSCGIMQKNSNEVRKWECRASSCDFPHVLLSFTWKEKKARIRNTLGNIFYWIFIACWWKMTWLLKYLLLLYGNKAMRCLSPSGSNAIETTVKLFIHWWLLFRLPPLLNSLQCYTPLPASWFPNKTSKSLDSKKKKKVFMETMGFLSMFWMDCMNYLKRILVSDISI